MKVICIVGNMRKNSFKAQREVKITSLFFWNRIKINTLYDNFKNIMYI